MVPNPCWETLCHIASIDHVLKRTSPHSTSSKQKFQPTRATIKGPTNVNSNNGGHQLSGAIVAATMSTIKDPPRPVGHEDAGVPICSSGEDLTIAFVPLSSLQLDLIRIFCRLHSPRVCKSKRITYSTKDISPMMRERENVYGFVSCVIARDLVGRACCLIVPRGWHGSDTGGRGSETLFSRWHRYLPW